jgi:hypothetical protein
VQPDRDHVVALPADAQPRRGPDGEVVKR